MAVTSTLIIKAVMNSKDAQKGIKGVGSSLKRVGIIAAGAFAVKGIEGFIKKTLELQAVQENAEKQLRSALKARNLFTEESTKSLVDLSKELQAMGLAGDEATLKMQALGIRMGQTAEQANKTVKASLELSAATGIDVNSAFTNLARTMSGQAGLLGRMGIDVSSLTKEQLKQGAAIDLVAEQFKGAAAEQASFTIGVNKLSFEFGDAQERIGGVIQDTGVLDTVFSAIMGSIAAMEVVIISLVSNLAFLGSELNRVFGDFAAFMNQQFGPAIKGGSELTNAFFDDLLELVTVENIFNGISDAVAGLSAALGVLFQSWVDIVNLNFSALEGRGQGTLDAAEQAIRENQARRTASERERAEETQRRTTARAGVLTGGFQVAGGAGAAGGGAVEAETKKAATARIEAEKTVQQELAVLRGQESLAFTLALNERATEFREAGVSQIEVARFVQESQLEFERQAAEERTQRTIEGMSGARQAFAEFATQFSGVADLVNQAAGSMLDAFSGGLSSAITSVFDALGKGEKINFKGLAGGLLKATGAAAIQLGTLAILSAGVAAAMGPVLSTSLGIPGGGAPLLAAGAALIAFGGASVAAGAALSKGGGGESASAGGGSLGGAGPSFGDQGIAARPQQQIALTINALDPTQVDWDDLAENQIGPALEVVVNRGASNVAVTPT